MEAPHNFSIAYESAVKIILQWDSTAAKETMISEGDSNEIDEYLQAVDEIQHSMELMSTSEDRSKATSVIQIAIARLGDEFVNILTCSTNPRYSTSSSSLSSISLTDTSYYDADYLDYDAPSDEAINHLRSIAERMHSVGHLRQCLQAYRQVRKALMELRFRDLGIENLSTDDVWELETEVLEGKTKRWIRIAKVCARVLFPNEKKLCEQIFHDLGIAIQDTYFIETIKDSAIRLFKFAEAISTGRRSLERLFSILELHQTMSHLFPDMEVLFQCKASEAIRIPAAEILLRLSLAAKEILWKFEKAVLDELSPFPAPGGTIHNLTAFVMKYIIRISVFKRTLVELLESKPSMDLRYSNDLMIPDLRLMELGERTPLGLQLIRIVVILQYKLEIKSKEYNDAPLAHFFMMNNVHYIIQRIEGCPELKNMIGSEYLKQLIGMFGQKVISYQRSTWLSVLHCLKDDGLVSWVSHPSSRILVREKLKTFYTLFKKVHQTQAAWSVPDQQLREELRILISQNLLPMYRTFISRHCNVVSLDRYIKYTCEELEAAALDFFKGNQERALTSNKVRFV
ncbi:hypothetical protein F0562_010668 [Nyssa sinensis]|uniref:Exocyst subunit Exo70 family protein n=1 Tax=Nyssa sinensis TaxID=561372 RepID=A0A5J4ZZJ1_9ASTE|nr:hypothetical protein F0562_010668 [Nyssa sinensis]